MGKALAWAVAVVAAASAAAGMVPIDAAGAATGPSGFTVAVHGRGYATPGLSVAAFTQHGGFGSTTTAAVGIDGTPGAAAGLGTCSFSWQSTGTETIAAGQGTATGTCSGGTVGTYSLSCPSMGYARVGLIWVWTPTTCSLTIDGSTTAVSGAGMFQLGPAQSGNVLNTWSFAGALAFAGS